MRKDFAYMRHLSDEKMEIEFSVFVDRFIAATKD